MPSYEQVNAQADKEMEQFLAGMANGQQSDKPGQQPPAVEEPSVNEEDFYADDDDAVTDLPNPAPSQPATPTYSPAQNPAPQMYTPEQLEYERRLAEERGRSAAYNDLIRTGANVQPQQQVEQPQQQGFFRPEDVEFTKEELETFSPETQAFANKIANRALQRVLDQVVTPLQQEIAMQRQQLENYGQGVAKTNSQVLYSQVQQHYPDLPEIVASQEWRTFMEQPSPVDSSVPLKNVFLHHLHNGRQHDILNIIKMFKQQNPGSQAQMQMQAAPGQSSVGNPPTTIPDRKPKMFDYSKYTDALARWQAGKMTYAEFSKIEKMYDKAMMEGRIKY